jgi:NitT/TauT family transport system permease protein
MVANGSIDTPLLFADLAVLTVLGVILFMLVELAERMVIPLHARAAGTGATESL